MGFSYLLYFAIPETASIYSHLLCAKKVLPVHSHLTVIAESSHFTQEGPERLDHLPELTQQGVVSSKPQLQTPSPVLS